MPYALPSPFAGRIYSAVAIGTVRVGEPPSHHHASHLLGTVVTRSRVNYRPGHSRELATTSLHSWFFLYGVRNKIIFFGR